MFAFVPTPTSSQVAEYAFDSVSQELHVKFRSGGHWKYLAVPPKVAEEFGRAESVGRFLHKEIKGHFVGIEVKDHAEEATITTNAGDVIDTKAAWPLPAGSES